MSIEIVPPLLFAAGLVWLVRHLWRRGAREPRRADLPGERRRDWVQRVPRIFTQPHLGLDARSGTSDAATGSDLADGGGDVVAAGIADATTVGGAREDAAREAVADVPEGARAGSGAAPRREPDDLQRIRGIGPVMERKLHERGVTTFAQIAAWGPKDVERFAAELRFGRRIERDGWVDQAKRWAADGAADG